MRFVLMKLDVMYYIYDVDGTHFHRNPHTVTRVRLLLLLLLMLLDLQCLYLTLIGS